MSFKNSFNNSVCCELFYFDYVSFHILFRSYPENKGREVSLEIFIMSVCKGSYRECKFNSPLKYSLYTNCCVTEYNIQESHKVQTEKMLKAQAIA